MCASFFPDGSEGTGAGGGAIKVLGGEWGHDENQWGIGIITVEVQVCGMQTHGKSGFTSSTDHKKKIFMFFLLIPFGERHVTSIKITK